MHTLIIYGAALVGLPPVDVTGLLGRRFGAKGNLSSHARGTAIHYFLGTTLFPFAFNNIVRFFLPVRKFRASVIWAMLLWITGDRIIIPLLGGEETFKRRPSAHITYWLAHLVYGVVCGRR